LEREKASVANLCFSASDAPIEKSSRWPHFKMVTGLQPNIDEAFQTCVAMRQAGCGSWHANKYGIARRVATA
jgi:hypothetical protein